MAPLRDGFARDVDVDAAAATFVITPADDLAGVGSPPRPERCLPRLQSVRDILHARTMNVGQGFYANGKLLNEVGNARSEARWRGAWGELIKGELIEPVEPASQFTLSATEVFESPNSSGPRPPPHPLACSGLDDNDVISILRTFSRQSERRSTRKRFSSTTLIARPRCPTAPLQGSSTRRPKSGTTEWPAGKNTITFAKGASHAPKTLAQIGEGASAVLASSVSAASQSLRPFSIDVTEEQGATTRDSPGPRVTVVASTGPSLTSETRRAAKKSSEWRRRGSNPQPLACKKIGGTRQKACFSRAFRASRPFSTVASRCEKYREKPHDGGKAGSQNGSRPAGRSPTTADEKNHIAPGRTAQNGSPPEGSIQSSGEPTAEPWANSRRDCPVWN